MVEKNKIFSSKVKYNGIFSFHDFYKFCHDWLNDETGMTVIEDKYVEKLSGDSKNIDVEWTTFKKVTDYFKFEITVKFKITALTNIEIVQGGAKIKTNQGSVEVGVTGTLIRDYEGKFETNAFNKFLRGIYEKWVITSNIDQMESKLAGDCDEFLGQAKAYLDLEGKSRHQ